MAHRTTKRAGMYVDTSSIAKQNKQSIESVIAYKGFADNKNNITNPQDSFVDLQNMYIDDDELLSTRAPMKKLDVNNIYRLYKISGITFIAYITDLGWLNIKAVNGTDTVEISLKYVSQEHLHNYPPKILFAPIEDNIFIFTSLYYDVSPGAWLTRIFRYNPFYSTIAPIDPYIPERYYYVSGIREDMESMNYFTNKYRNRYLYSAISSVPFRDLEGEIKVYDKNKKYLGTYYEDDYGYHDNLPLELIQKYMVNLNYQTGGNKDFFDVVEREDGKVVTMIYYRESNILKIGFNNKYLTEVNNMPSNIVENFERLGRPILFRDGSGVAFLCADGIYMANIDNPLADNYMQFVRKDYFSGAPTIAKALGYFLNEDTYVIYWRDNNAPLRLLVHWYQNGAVQEYNTSDTSKGAFAAINGMVTSVRMCTYSGSNANLGPMVLAITQGQSNNSNNSRWSGYQLTFLENNSGWTGGTYTHGYGTITRAGANSYMSLSPEYLVNGTANVYFSICHRTVDYAHFYIEKKYIDRSLVTVQGDMSYVGGLILDASATNIDLNRNAVAGYQITDIYCNDTTFLIELESLSSNPYTYKYYISKGYGSGTSFNFNTDMIETRLVNGPTYGNVWILCVLTKGYNYWGIVENRDLYTNYISADNPLYLDETKTDPDWPAFEMPTHFASLEEHYFSFGHKLGITVTKYDDDNRFSLYIPISNMESFVSDITNLHPIYTNTMAVFLKDSVWYMNEVENDTTILYKRPVKSKLPFGCREGIQIMTLADGQSIMFPVDRGLAVLSPQDFVATTDPVIKYISDDIQNFYLRYYSDTVRTAEVALVTGVKFNTYFERPLEIKSCIYRYWLLIYKRYSNIVLIYDMRNGTWWKWKMPYPIVDLIVDDGVVKMALYIVNAAEGTLDPTGQTITYDNTSDFGTLYQLDDKNANILLDEQRFPRIAEDFDDYDYSDEIVPGTLDGTVTDVTDQYSRQSYQEYHLAQSRIDWYGLSQKLYLGSINNYKAIRGINIVARGLYNAKAMLEVKIFRDVFHPEESLTMNMYIEDLRSFVQRLNLMHVIFFQFRISNPDNDEKQKQVHIASVSIKYETKEGIR